MDELRHGGKGPRTVRLRLQQVWTGGRVTCSSLASARNVKGYFLLGSLREMKESRPTIAILDSIAIDTFYNRSRLRKQ